MLDLKSIYNLLNGKYELTLTTGLTLDAGFGWDLEVLTGKCKAGQFFLYDEGFGAIFDYNDPNGTISNKHWHPADNQEAIQYVIDFMEDKLL